jgi:O-acetyl-ADP-ribose deacetylase (regulator of RNase III)
LSDEAAHADIRMTHTVANLVMELAQGNIASQPDLDAVVNAANADLAPGAGVAGAIHRAAGPGLDRECRPLAPIRPGQAVITGAHDLPNKRVIHCLGPVYGRDVPSDVILAECFAGALRLAEENALTSIGFPAISTGVFGYPMPAAARVALKTVIDTAPALRAVRVVRFVLFSAADLETFADVLRGLTAVD